MNTPKYVTAEIVCDYLQSELWEHHKTINALQFDTHENETFILKPFEVLKYLRSDREDFPLPSHALAFLLHDWTKAEFEDFAKDQLTLVDYAKNATVDEFDIDQHEQLEDVESALDFIGDYGEWDTDTDYLEDYVPEHADWSNVYYPSDEWCSQYAKHWSYVYIVDFGEFPLSVSENERDQLARITQQEYTTRSILSQIEERIDHHAIDNAESNLYQLNEIIASYKLMRGL
jgi:hypothetical protein